MTLARSGPTVTGNPPGVARTMFQINANRLAVVLAVVALLGWAAPAWPSGPEKATPLLRSARSGTWSSSTTWEGGKVPTSGARVQIKASHRVVYDVKSDHVIRSIHIAGEL